MIPLYSMSLFINQWGAGSIRKEISKSTFSKMHFYLNTLENDVIRIKKRQLGYLQDDDLHMLSVAPEIVSEYDKSRMINDLHDKLQDLKDSSNYIKKASIIIPSMQLSISTGHIVEPIPGDEFKALMDLLNKVNSPMLFWNQRLFISVYYPELDLSEKEQPMFLFDTEISLAALEKTLSQFSDYTDSGLMLLDVKQNWFVTNKNNDAIVTQIKQFLKQQLKTNESTYIGSMKINNKKYMLTYEVSDYLNAALLAYVPEKQIMGTLHFKKSGIRHIYKPGNRIPKSE